ADCDVLVTAPDFKGIDFRGMLRDIHAEDPGAVRLVVDAALPSAAAAAPGASTSGRAPFATVDYAHLLDAEPPGPRTGDASRTASAFTSSGSIGVPQIIMPSQAGLIGHSTAVAHTFSYTDVSTVVLAALPLCGVVGLNTRMGALAARRHA